MFEELKPGNIWEKLTVKLSKYWLIYFLIVAALKLTLNPVVCSCSSLSNTRQGEQSWSLIISRDWHTFWLCFQTLLYLCITLSVCHTHTLTHKHTHSLCSCVGRPCHQSQINSLYLFISLCTGTLMDLMEFSWNRVGGRVSVCGRG